MKHLLSVLVLAAVMTACNSNQENIGKEQTLPAVDTTGLAQLQAIKAQAALIAYEDSIKASEAAKERTATAPKRKVATQSATQSETINYESADAAKEENKGWSKKAKGAVIGAGTGAAAGAVIHKKDRVVGGVVGGVVGAAAGYGIGRQKDKKDGRN